MRDERATKRWPGRSGETEDFRAVIRGEVDAAQQQRLREICAYPFIQTGDVRNCDHVILESTQSYNEIGLAQSKLWPKGTICITIAANIAETGILGFEACFPDSVIGIVVDETKTTNDFVEYLLQSVIRCHRRLLSRCARGGSGNLHRGLSGVSA
jgi:Type I restriction modification DNA specificity domain